MLVRAAAGGYLQHVHRDGLVEMAEEHDALVRMGVRPGDFVSKDQVLIEVRLPARDLTDPIRDQFRDAFAVGDRRTNLQDLRFGVQQLTEIASRALSPGINDPSTAMGCTDWLKDSLVEIALSDEPTGVRRGADGKPRLLEEPVSFPELARLAFGPVRAYGAGNVVVAEHLLHALAGLAQAAVRPADLEAVLKEAELTAAAAFASLSSSDDHRRVREALHAVHRPAAV